LRVGLSPKDNYCTQQFASLTRSEEASILLLDEPVAGVHPEMAQKILSLLRKLRDDGKLIIFIEHDISAVREVADHVIVMDHGRIRAQGPPKEVLEQPEIMEAYVA
jgi:branched-chain amino acid transport system ATP-binding protein